MSAPRVSGGWMLQHARRMRNDPLGFLVDCADEQGDMVEFPIPAQRVFFVNDPDAVGRILQGNHRAYGKDTLQYSALRVVTGPGLLVSEGEEWLRGRRMVQPAFHHRTLAALAEHVAAAADRLVADWGGQSHGSDVDVDAAMMRTTLEVVGHALFSTDLGPSAGDLVGAVLDALDRVVSRARSPLPLPLSWPSPGNRRLRAAVATLDAKVESMVRARRAIGPDGQDDLLGLLLANQDPTAAASPQQQQEVRDQVVTLIVAGHETVASALTWAWWLVAGDPRVARALAQESRVVLGRRSPTLADYPRLPYARAVLDEALRLYPPAWVVTRRVLQDDVLVGTAVPAGSVVIASPYALHRNPRVWRAPEVFAPERFLAGGEQVPRLGYLPFGAGPRMCVGREFALVEGVLLLAAIASRFGLTRRPGQRVQADPSVTVRAKGGLRLVLHKG